MRDVNGSVNSATAARVDFIVTGTEEAMMAWEQALLDHFTKDQLIANALAKSGREQNACEGQE